jgi:TRAP transporter TAXI family solute receptor
MDRMTGWAAALAMAATAAGAQELPDTMIWSTYDVGSTGHTEASAISDALTSAHGTRVRLLPSGTGIGRVLPLTTERADAAWLANELYFATRGLHDFAAPDWGPQDMRVLIGRPSSYGIVTTQESGIEGLADLEGVRFAYSAANPSISIKNDALLAAAGLTRDDVEVIEFPSYNDALVALVQGQADVAGASTTSSTLYELEASPRGIAWVELDPENAQIWSQMEEVAPIFAPIEETVGAGITDAEPVNLAAYRYPMITVMSDADADTVYATVKALDEGYDAYADAAPIMERWDLARSGTKPMDAPFHEGAIRYLEEKGMWSEEDQAWQDAQLAEMEALRAAWDEVTAEGLDGDAFAEAWAERRDAILSGAEG